MNVGGPTAAPARAVCASCDCVLARDNAGRLCSPCATREGRRRWLAVAPTTPDGPDAEAFIHRSPQDLMRLHGLDAEQLVDVMLSNGVLPARLRRYRGLIARLLGMGELSHSAAARELGVTRWTVAAWRERIDHTHRTDSTTTGRQKEDER